MAGLECVSIEIYSPRGCDVEILRGSRTRLGDHGIMAKVVISSPYDFGRFNGHSSRHWFSSPEGEEAVLNK